MCRWRHLAILLMSISLVLRCKFDPPPFSPALRTSIEPFVRSSYKDRHIKNLGPVLAFLYQVGTVLLLQGH